jgi:hypothetical protein
MRLVCAVVLWWTLMWSGIATAQQRVSGRVIDRNGSPQPRCLVEFFYPNGPLAYQVTANDAGYFFLDNPRHGAYTLWVRSGPRQYQLNVSINQQGLQPSTIVVSW